MWTIESNQQSNKQHTFRVRSRSMFRTRRSRRQGQIRRAVLVGVDVLRTELLNLRILHRIDERIPDQHGDVAVQRVVRGVGHRGALLLALLGDTLTALSGDMLKMQYRNSLNVKRRKYNLIAEGDWTNHISSNFLQHNVVKIQRRFTVFRRAFGRVSILRGCTINILRSVVGIGRYPLLKLGQDFAQVCR